MASYYTYLANQPIKDKKWESFVSLIESEKGLRVAISNGLVPPMYFVYKLESPRLQFSHMSFYNLAPSPILTNLALVLPLNTRKT